MENEIWKDVVGWEGLYRVSNMSRLYSTKNNIILKPGVGGKGYHYVTLYGNGSSRGFAVHRLVLIAFVGPCPEGVEACHYDNNKINNKLENLRWDTPINNKKLDIRGPHYCIPIGERVGSAKLTEKEVREIRRLGKMGMKHSEISKLVNKIHPRHLSNIIRRTCWKHI